jgi:hypothetical protein
MKAKTPYPFRMLIAATACIISFIFGIYIERSRELVFLQKAKSALTSFLYQDYVWSIGIYTGDSLILTPPSQIKNPVLTAHDVTDVRALFVADPFMV